MEAKNPKKDHSWAAIYFVVEQRDPAEIIDSESPPPILAHCKICFDLKKELIHFPYETSQQKGNAWRHCVKKHAKYIPAGWGTRHCFGTVSPRLFRPGLFALCFSSVCTH